jgi:hypothetical protein
VEVECGKRWTYIWAVLRRKAGVTRSRVKSISERAEILESQTGVAGIRVRKRAPGFTSASMTTLDVSHQR